MEIGSLVLHSAVHERVARFYRAIGIDLEEERHDDGPAHYAAELGPFHFAVYPAESPGYAPPRRSGGSSFAGFFVDSLDATAASLADIAAPILGEHEQMPWGCRMVLQDTDGRPVEINQRHHCS